MLEASGPFGFGVAANGTNRKATSDSAGLLGFSGVTSVGPAARRISEGTTQEGGAGRRLMLKPRSASAMADGKVPFKVPI